MAQPVEPDIDDRSPPPPSPPPARRPPRHPPPLAGLVLPSLQRRHTQPVARAWVLTNPDGAFHAALARPRLMLTALVVAAFALLPPLSFLARADLDAVVTAELKQQATTSSTSSSTASPTTQTTTLTPEQQATATAALRVVLPLAAVAKRLLPGLLLALLAWLLLRGQRPQLSWVATWSVVLLASAPLLLADALTATTFLVLDPALLDIKRPLWSNVAAWIPDAATQNAHVLGALSAVDFFSVWCVWWTARGLTALAGRPTLAAWALPGGGLVLAVVLAAI